MVKKIKLGSDYRLIAISDIHGGYDHFFKLINEINLIESDYLFVLGDFLEKGLKSKELIDYLKELNKRERTFILKGNNEDFFLKCVFKENFSEILIKYMKYKEYGSLFDFYFSKLEIDIKKHSGKELQEIIKENFTEDLDFLSNLDTIVETEDFIFVHAGIEKIDNWENTKEHQLLYLDKFLEKGHNSEKTVVVGHWPCSNYRKDSLSNSIIIDEKKKIISLDGGYGVKEEGQINGLIINSFKDNKKIESIWVDLLPIYELNEDTEYLEGNNIKIGWPNHEIEVVEEGQSFSLCKILGNNQITKVKNELIHIKDEKTYCIQDYIYKFYNGKKGDKIKLVKKFPDFSLIKSQDDFFWIKTSSINRII